MSYKILVSQTHSFMSNSVYANRWIVNDIQDVDVPENCFTQIGDNVVGVYCLNLVIKPSGLTIPIFVTNRDNVLDTLIKINDFLASDDLNIQTHFSLNSKSEVMKQNLIIMRGEY